MKKRITLFSVLLLFTLPIFAQDIFTAIQENDVVGVRYFVTKGTDLNTKDKQGSTPLITAVKGGQYKIVRLLVCRDIKVNLQDKAGNTALIVACQNSQDDKSGIVDLLTRQYPDFNLANKQGTTPLIAAVNANNTDAVKLLLAHGADALIKDKQKKTAVDYARDLRNNDILAMLSSPAQSEPGKTK